MIIAVLNKSTHVKTQDAVTMTTACYYQQLRHFAPAWGRTASSIVFAIDSAHVPHGAKQIVIFDDSDAAGALGYHDETPTGQVYGRVFVNPTIEAGGGILTGGSLALSTVLSHEVCELVADPLCNLWASAPDGNDYALEVCDPVEDDYYEILVGTQHIAVSNFVFPEWFDETPPVGARYDQLGRVTYPFTMTPNGYVIYKTTDGIEQKFGHSYPEWKKQGKTHPAARTARRLSSI